MAGFATWLRGLLDKAEPVPTHSPPPVRTSQPAQSFAEDSNDFALAMYGQIRQRPGNVFFSPFSIRTALGMTLAGARGETAAQMRKALCISSSDQALHVALGETLQRLNAAGRGNYELTVANSLWGQEGTSLQPDFLDVIARHYGGAMNLVDFRGGAEAARLAVNEWVEDKTVRKIREIIPSGGVGADTRLVLVNAIYFKGMWALQFRKAATQVAPFHLAGGGKVQAPLMHQHAEVRYLRAAGYHAIDLDYRRGDLSMLVLLPERKDALRDLEMTLSARMLQDAVAQMRPLEVELFLPRFKITWGAVVSNALTTLGMPFAFTRSQADFSGINGRQPPDKESLVISAVFHRAFVEVNEEGTEAAAATAVALALGGPAIFRADHPFLFAIRDRKSGVILFLGRIADPTRES